MPERSFRSLPGHPCCESLGKIRNPPGWLPHWGWDNASSNNTWLEALSNRLEGRETDFDPGRRRIRCFGHVLNLCLQAFLLACSKEALRAALATASIAPGAKSVEASSATLDESEFPVSRDVADYAPSQNQSLGRRHNQIKSKVWKCCIQHVFRQLCNKGTVPFVCAP